ncbi:class I SAM-dependent methyltransferase [Streptomyces sp. DG2A-72]|uniref:class I SAM-dependent methyltransferase n=1 Tax=Streptomyces sp. DG2A-72 TaxID=3051386 RepID=UPI00265C0D38|nr:class I SAM-dependent methyltransferase [Streptomyces sp. DG2A-72]MDO0938292.1 class I SAM-dependent methyltransferase [Streptomyces sp. DG2A-72]
MTTPSTRAALRTSYQADLADGTARFLEPRRPDCPWCGSTTLQVHLTSPDFIQAKPGSFTLERCRDCRHIFQNPRLNASGLEFYYRDLYDGLGAKSVEFGFSLMRKLYQRRARMLQPYTTPRAWLDVGTGYGHFCHTAKQIWPQTTFAGLDRGDGVREAQRRGWIDDAHQGSFPDLADTLTHRYDVVSMHHYLEHTIDPIAEIRAAAHVLPPGGHLLIEVPDPECAGARLLGKYWSQWVQPQHLHMFPVGNLKQALAANGLSILTVERRRADLGLDFLLGAKRLLSTLAQDPRRPWVPRPPTTTDHARWAAALLLALPALPAGLLLDLTVRPLLPRHSNAYRILAAKAPAQSTGTSANRSPQSPDL